MEGGSTTYCLRVREWWSTFHYKEINSCSQNVSLVTEPEFNENLCKFSSCCRKENTCNSGENCQHGQEGRPPKILKTYSMDKLVNLLIPKVYAESLAASETKYIPQIVKEQKTQMTVAEKVSTSKPKILISDQQMQDYLSKETGRDRVKAMYEKVNNEASSEMMLVLSASQHAGGLAFLAMSILGAIEGKERFIRQNKHTKFLTKFRAARAYSDAVFLNALRFGIRWGVKIFVFSGIFLFTSQTIAVYRNKTSVMEYVAAGALTCSLHRLNLGLKGAFAGGIIGATMGLIAGGGICGVMWMNNETQDQRHYWHVQQLLKKEEELRLLTTPSQSSSTQPPQDQEAVFRNDFEGRGT